MEERTRQVARLWTLVQPAVSAFVSSMVVDFKDRDDVLQEIAVAVIDSFDRYDPQRPFAGWAIGIARNHVRTYLRTRQRDRHVFDSAAVEAIAQAFTEVASTASARAGYLSQCAEKLDERAQQLCDMRYSQGLQPAAIGGKLNMSANSVAKALQRVREQLRDCINRKLAMNEG